jgi:hypothetical protein
VAVEDEGITVHLSNNETSYPR